VRKNIFKVHDSEVSLFLDAQSNYVPYASLVPMVVLWSINHQQKENREH